MARKMIIADDLIDLEITESQIYAVKMTIEIVTPETADSDGKPVAPEKLETSAEWELAAITANSLYRLVNDSDLASLIGTLRQFVKVAAPDSEIVRKWARETHPELKVPERGRLGAEIVALYRQEVVRKSETGDTK